MKLKLTAFLILIFFVQIIFGQPPSKRVDPILDVKLVDGLLQVTVYVQGKTDITETIIYELKIIKESKNSNKATNTANNSQTGRRLLNPFEKSNLGTTSINIGSKERVIVLLLIYDENHNLIANKQEVFNDNKSEVDIKKELAESLNVAMQNQKAFNKEIKSEQESKPIYTMRQAILVDQTKTKAGRDFYQLFYGTYLSRNIDSDKLITITESITLGNNTKVAINVDGHVIFEFFVKTQYDFLKTMSESSMQMVLRYLENQKVESQRIQTF